MRTYIFFLFFCFLLYIMFSYISKNIFSFCLQKKKKYTKHDCTLCKSKHEYIKYIKRKFCVTNDIIIITFFLLVPSFLKLYFCLDSYMTMLYVGLCIYILTDIIYTWIRRTVRNQVKVSRYNAYVRNDVSSSLYCRIIIIIIMVSCCGLFIYIFFLLSIFLHNTQKNNNNVVSHI